MKHIKRIWLIALSVIVGTVFCLTIQAAPASAADLPEKLVLNGTSIVLVKGQKVDLFLYDRNAQDYDELTDSLAYKTVKWKSTKKKVATVTKDGIVKAKKAGKATIKATYKGRTYKCKIRVYKSLSKKQRTKMARKQAKRIVKTYTKPSMSKKEKAYRLAIYLFANLSQQGNQSGSAYKKNYGNEEYAALNMHLAACSGYCKAYKMLCKEAGIPCKHVNANKWTHQWNKVKIGGKWYKVDTQIAYVGFKVSEELQNRASVEWMDHGHFYTICLKLNHGFYE